ncbi:MAG TPA: DUF6111 family protein [Bauldia sp.]|nr:DUF6111 family protein [Bauldia sp.]
MVRFFAFDGVLFLLPFAVYALWLLVTRRSLSNTSDWTIRTIGYLALVGALLVIVVLVIFIQRDTDQPGGTYVPAHLENGVIVPGHFEPAK